LAARLTAGLLLAMGPLIIVLALFDATVGLLEGWLRALFGSALGLTGVLVITSFEASFLENALATAGVDQAADIAGQGLLVISSLFALAILATLIVAAIVANGLRLPRTRVDLASTTASLGEARPPNRALAVARSIRTVPEAPSRAAVVASAVALQSRRETLRLVQPPSSTSPAASGFTPSLVTSPGPYPLAARPLGHSFRRTPTPRRGAVASQRKDRR
jgi:type IV secretion system protein VirB6